MAYTVKELAELSGVSIRTLHFYDEIGLLKPARYGENGYRYYEERELLALQQILFYRELGFPLAEIQEVLRRKDFDRIEALLSHRQALARRMDQTRSLIETIDKTIARLRGEGKMSDKEIYLGFDPKKQAEYEKYWIDRGGGSLVEESRKRTKGWQKKDYDGVKAETDAIHRDMAALLVSGKPASSPETQAVIRRHYRMVDRFYTPTRDIYIGLGSLYIENPEFRKVYDSFHPKLAEYMAESMRIYAQAELS